MFDWLTVLALVTALGSATIGGVFFAFSVFVMQALAARPVPEGVAAMQSINRVILRSPFMVVFLATFILSLGLIYGAMKLDAPGALWLIAGAALYAAGGFGVTILCNVPLNARLERTDAAGLKAPAVWADYLRRWMLWNHLRTVACLGGAAACVWGLLGG